MSGFSRWVTLAVALAAMVTGGIPAAQARTITVGPNREYPRIQTGINAAQDGDTVLVYYGTYLEMIVFYGNKTITVRTEEGATINADIDYGGTGEGTAVTFRSGAQSTLDGFYIQNGKNVNGGGIACYSSSPTIKNCTIVDNYADKGGGIYSENSSPTIIDCYISGNFATNGDGGGIYGDATITGSTVSYNTSSGGVSGGGGGIYGSGSFTNCSFDSNTTLNSNGGGIYAYGPFTITDSLISNNISRNGGGIYYVGDGYPFLMAGCTITGNSAGPGGGIYLVNKKSTSQIINCTITGNKASYSTPYPAAGGGIIFWGVSEFKATIINSTISGNNGPNTIGSGIAVISGSLIVNNSILWGNGGRHEDEIWFKEDSASVWTYYSVIERGLPSDTNPLFVDPRDATSAPTSDGDYHLQDGSPCLDNARGSLAPPYDIDGDIRPQGAGYDIGSDEFSYPCSPLISHSAKSFNFSGGTDSVSVTAQGGCDWFNTSNDDWITITSGTSGNGDGTVDYSVSANPTGLERTGTATIAGVTFTVTQEAAPCTYDISPTDESFDYNEGTGSINVTTLLGCPWNVIENTGWITITSSRSGIGDGTVSYSVSENTAGISRTGEISIGGNTFTVTQTGAPCIYSLSPTGESFDYNEGQGSLNVTAPIGCDWTAVSDDWITITSPNPDSGSRTVSYSVSANPAKFERTGTITIESETFTVTQSGRPCIYSISPAGNSFAVSGGSGDVDITSPIGCEWTAVSNDSWITITSNASGSGDGAVSYSVSNNTGPDLRTGTITIEDTTFTVTQSGCIYSISPSGNLFDYSGGSGDVSISTLAGCEWTAISDDSWITITSGNPGSGDGTITYSISANTSFFSRIGTITIMGEIFSITQKEAPCLITVPDDYGTIQEAIDNAGYVCEIIVKPKQDLSPYRENIVFPSNKAINLRANGDVSIDGGELDSVVKFSSRSSGSVLDGFTITNGSGEKGGGIYCLSSSPSIINCTISGNNGGGIYCLSSSPSIVNCTISGNNGGGIYCLSSSPSIINCTISGNSSASSGGGISCGSSSPSIINCTISGNSASYGGGISCGSSSPSIINCTISGNNAWKSSSSGAGGGGDLHC